jgi:hypothetical protein
MCCAKVEQELLLIIGVKFMDIVIFIYRDMATVTSLSIMHEWTKVCEVVAVKGNLSDP